MCIRDRYQAAHEDQQFADELVPYTVSLGKGKTLLFDKDEHPRLSTLEALGTLKPAFKKEGSVTAGNSSGINDGASALLLVNKEALAQYQLKAMAKIKSMAIAGVDPSVMGIGPVPAVRKALQRAGLSIADIDLFELNEAFASQSLACIQELGIDTHKVNVNGGAIAIGHPLGASGARISTTLLHEMKKRNAKYGIATMCIGVGQGAAIVYELVNE
jgi:acetyl-CoA acetyltransferase family protein